MGSLKADPESLWKEIEWLRSVIDQQKSQLDRQERELAVLRRPINPREDGKAHPVPCAAGYCPTPDACSNTEKCLTMHRTPIPQEVQEALRERLAREIPIWEDVVVPDNGDETLRRSPILFTLAELRVLVAALSAPPPQPPEPQGWLDRYLSDPASRSDFDKAYRRIAAEEGLTPPSPVEPSEKAVEAAEIVRYSTLHGDIRDMLRAAYRAQFAPPSEGSPPEEKTV